MKILFIIYDNGSYMQEFPIGVAQLTAVLEKAGYNVDIYHQDIHHYPAEHLTDFLDKNHYDLVGLSFIGGYWQYKKALEISNAINKSKKRPFYAIGGHGPSPEPEFFLKKTQCDAVCIGEGDETILDLLDAIATKRSLASVLGIAYRDGDSVHVNKRRPVIKNIDHLPYPAYHKFPMMLYRLARMPHSSPTDFIACILSGRGCTFKCNFCYRMDPGFRPRSNEVIIDEIKLLKKNYGITYIAFYDELLMSSKKRVVSLCEDMLAANLNIKWECNGRLNYATPEVLSIMKRAGCVFINYGIEAMDDKILHNMHKNLTTKQIITGIEATLAAQMSPGFNIIFGNIGENKETLMKGVEFLLKYDNCAQLRTIRPVTPYPGSELYYQAIASGLIKDCEDFYENKHTNSDLLSCNFTDLTDSEFYEALYTANCMLLENYITKTTANTKNILHSLYIDKNSAFRGFRSV